METIGERIKMIRKEKGLTQQRFAAELGLKQNTIATYEMNRTAPSDRTISDICRHFRVSEEWLRTGIGDMIVEDSVRDKLNVFFQDVLASAPDERSEFVAALADLPAEFWPVVAELAKKYAEKYKEH